VSAVGAMLATVVDTDSLLKTVAAAFVAGVGVTLVFSIAIFGVARFAEMGREGRVAAAVVYGVLGVLAALVFTAAIVTGIIVMTQK
jgi:hypothetical protein